MVSIGLTTTNEEGTQMTTLVTGAAGRVGSRFVPRLLTEGEHTRVLVRDAEAVKGLRQRGADVVEGDLRDPDAVRRTVEGVDRIVHLAAAFRGVAEEEVVAVNQAATVDLARAALAAGAGRFVLASTNLVYGHSRGRPARESDLPAPDRAYPQSKAAAEDALCELWYSEGLGLRILRFAFVYGEGDPHLAESLMWARLAGPHAPASCLPCRCRPRPPPRAERRGIDGMIINIADDAPVTALELHQLNGEPVPQDAASLPLDDPWEGIVDTTTARDARLPADLPDRVRGEGRGCALALSPDRLGDRMPLQSSLTGHRNSTFRFVLAFVYRPSLRSKGCSYPFSHGFSR